MKKLFALAFLALSYSAQAQTTNFTALRITMVTNGVTDQINITLNTRESEGLLLNYVKDVVTAGTNAPPTIQNSVKATVNTFLLAPIAQQARADERKQQKVEAFLPLVPEIWDGMTQAERNQLITLANKYATNSVP